jgi:hypothetical protein
MIIQSLGAIFELQSHEDIPVRLKYNVTLYVTYRYEPISLIYLCLDF